MLYFCFRIDAESVIVQKMDLKLRTLLEIPSGGEVDDTRFEKLFDMLRPYCLQVATLECFMKAGCIDVFMRALDHVDFRVQAVGLRLIGHFASSRRGFDELRGRVDVDLLGRLRAVVQLQSADLEPLVVDSALKGLTALLQGADGSAQWHWLVGSSTTVPEAVLLHLQHPSNFVAASAVALLVEVATVAVRLASAGDAEAAAALRWLGSALQSMMSGSDAPTLLSDSTRNHVVVRLFDVVIACLPSTEGASFLRDTNLLPASISFLRHDVRTVRRRALDAISVACAQGRAALLAPESNGGPERASDDDTRACAAL
eukprot:TRINITY_DN17000_c0_g1_i1.p1 TRINITY_DN17000_c0_g1~~TRINITY_DN17000_c0_g1_i1.p1  ORF type:complete len:315 (+),score=57.73 TRINITY_DN17000_c0_g1_i1:158-1102(+)